MPANQPIELPMEAERSEEEKARIVALSEALRQLAKTNQDRRIAAWLEEVVERVDRYAETPTKGQMMGALGYAELAVNQRLDEILTGISALREAVRSLSDRYEDLAGKVSGVSPEEARRAIDLVEKHEQLFQGLVTAGRLTDVGS